MTLDPIGLRSAGMNDSDRVDAAQGDGVKEVQLSKAARAEAPPAGPELEGKTSPLTPAEAGAGRVGESKFQGMMVRENLLSGAHDPALASRLAKGVEVQDRLNLGAAEPALAHQLGDIKGESQDKSRLGAAEPALASRPESKLSEAGVWAEKFAERAPSHGDPHVKLSEQKHLEIQDKLSFPKQVVSMIGQKLEGQAADKDLQIQDKLSFPKQVVQLSGEGLSPITRRRD